MSNINYPSWESGIPNKMPDYNPYTKYFNWVKYKDDSPFVTNTFSVSLVELKIAWTYTEILKWLREEHKLLICVDVFLLSPENKIIYDYSIFNFNKYDGQVLGDYEVNFGKDEGLSTYEQALDEAILYCLNLIKYETK